GALEARGLRGRAQGEQPVEEDGLRDVGPRAGLGRVLRRRGPRHPGRLRGLGAERGLRPLRPRGHAAARDLGGRPHVPRPTARAGEGTGRAGGRRAVDATRAAVGAAVGQLYVQRYFPPAAKARIEEMARNIMTAFGRRIDALDWMAPATRARAKAKLATLKVG